MGSSVQTPPRVILFATDLSARCDRALDRAVLLAKQHQAKLVALHVLESGLVDSLTLPTWRRNVKDQQKLAQERLTHDLQGVDVQVEVVVETGKPVDVIEKVAQAHGAGLIVSGIARDETLGRIVLGTTVEKLVRQSDIPVLVVKSRAQRPYVTVLAATDFSEGSRQSVRIGRALAPDASLSLFHAFDIPTRGAGSEGVNSEILQERAEAKAAEFIAGTPELANAKPEVIYALGQPDVKLPAYVLEHPVDLVVAGTHGATGILRTALGSVAEGLLASLPTDVLVVRQRG
jgi:nucleotide-binding universal stress UspA family protein